MKSLPRVLVVVSCAAVLSSCTTQILDTVTTTVPAETTTTTMATPTGDILELAAELESTIDGLGQKIVDGDGAGYRQANARTAAIWEVLKPQVEASGVIGLDEDFKRIVGLVNTATTRKRPADADKASRFLAIVRESLPGLLAN